MGNSGCREAAKRMVGSMGSAPSPISPSEPDRLTGRERDMLRMFAQGKSYVEIAEVWDKNPMTIRNAVYEMQRKLGVRLGVWAARIRLLDEDEMR